MKTLYNDTKKLVKRISLTKSHYLFLILVLAFLLFYPSLTTFFTHDDFFLLNISKVNSLSDFINFFNLASGPEGLGMYRPLAMQSFYYLGWVFNLNPFWLHVIAMITFFIVIYLVYRLAKLLTNNDFISLASAFLYATSASHFSHLYFLGVYQELALTLLFLLAAIFFTQYLINSEWRYYVFSIIAFVLALLSKETAVVFIGVQIMLYAYLKFKKKTKVELKKFIVLLTPVGLLLLYYAYMRMNYYGFPQGDSYIWDFSLRFINTLFWYGLWSLNIPEMLVDFIGPGIKVNPNLFTYWKNEIIQIFILFILLVITTAYLTVSFFRKKNRKSLLIILFSGLWFVITLLPILFLPWHKFTYYLTLPLFGVALAISVLLEEYKQKKIVIVIFFSLWVLLSVATINLTSNTHWIIRGSKTAKYLQDYINTNKDLSNRLVFYDTKDDNLPWSATETLKVITSGEDFFRVFWGDKYEVEFLSEKPDENSNASNIRSSKILQY